VKLDRANSKFYAGAQGWISEQAQQMVDMNAKSIFSLDQETCHLPEWLFTTG
jgi:hypothetical protein